MPRRTSVLPGTTYTRNVYGVEHTVVALGDGTFLLDGEHVVPSLSEASFRVTGYHVSGLLRFWTATRPVYERPARRANNQQRRGSQVQTIEAPNLDAIAESLLVPTWEPWIFSQTVRIGADPELELYQNNRPVPARTINVTSLSARLGADGARHAVELRPRPGTGEYVFSEVKGLIKRLVTKCQNSNVLAYAGAGRWHYTGGHIHFSGISTYNSDLHNALNRWISEPLNAACDPERVRTRHNHGYGRAGFDERHYSWRVQPWGWEYRTPPSWLSHPIVARGALAIAYVLAAGHDAETDQEAYATVDSRQELIGRSGEYAEAIREFYEYLDGLVANGVFLENVEITQSWRNTTVAATRRRRTTAAPAEQPVSVEVILPEGAYPVEASTDHNIPEIAAGLTCDVPVHVFGAAASRVGHDAILVSQNLYNLVANEFSRTSELNGITLQNATWQYRDNYIYLSRSLRNGRSGIRRSRSALIRLLSLINQRLAESSAERSNARNDWYRAVDNLVGQTVNITLDAYGNPVLRSDQNANSERDVQYTFVVER